MSEEITTVVAWPAMNHGTQLKHLEHRHGARGFMRPEDWEAWHEAAHLAELAHEHSSPWAVDTSGRPEQPEVPPAVFRPPTVRPHTGNGPRTVQPTPEQAAAAWSCDLRNPAFARDSPGTTVIVDESDYNGGFEMV